MTASLGDDDVAIELEAVQGNAAIGRVTEAGARATSLVGHRVLVGAIDPCGECEVCRRGGAAVCPTARRRETWPDRVVAAGRWLVPLDGELTLAAPEAAAVAGDVALAYTLYARTGAAPHEPVVVVGATPVTRFLVEILVAKGLTFVVVADPTRLGWCAWLAAKGIAVVHVAPTPVLVAELGRVFATHGFGAKPWRVIATAAEAADLGAELAGPRATLTLRAPVTSIAGALATREVTVIGVAAAHPDLVVEVAAMCVKGEIDLAAGTSVVETDDCRAVVSHRGPAT